MKFNYLVTASVLFGVATAASAQIRITEYSASPTPEFVEFTNVGVTAINMNGWFWSDSDADSNDISFNDASLQSSLGSGQGFGLVQPGASVIFTETSVAIFRATWTNIPSSVVIVGNNSNSNLGSGGDQINIYNASEALVDRLTFLSATSGNPTSRNILPANLGTNNAAASVLSASGDQFGSYVSTSGNRFANPGTYSIVPEPTSLALLGLGAMGLVARRRKA